MNIFKSYQYRYNKDTLSYEKVRLSSKERILGFIVFLLASSVIGAFIVFAFFKIYDTPEEKKLKRELKQLSELYEEFDGKITKHEAVLDVMQDRDDNIYRVVFETEPISSTIREVGIGGQVMEEPLMSANYANMIESTSDRLKKIEERISIQSKSYDTIVYLAKKKAKMIASLPAIQPISNKDLKRVASGFGYRIHPIYKMPMMHAGIDFTAPIGTEIYATGNGVVHEIGKANRGYGIYIIINHGFGYKTLYAHMSKVAVKKGQKLKRGEVIGFVGNSGTSTAPHLHYEVMKNEKKIDPVNYFYADLTPAQYEKMLIISSRNNQTFD